MSVPNLLSQRTNGIVVFENRLICLKCRKLILMKDDYHLVLFLSVG